jgi:sugar lactone lactonase YvrE
MDDDGVLYAADFGAYVPGMGKIWRIEPNPEDPARAGGAAPVVEGLWGPNGIVMDRERGRLYFTETLAGTVKVLEKDGSGSYASEPTLLLNADMPGPKFPILDDLALDARGNLYVCHYNGNRILVVSPEGRPIGEFVPEGLFHPTAVAFGVMPGDRKDLYVTQKGHMMSRERYSGDRLSRIRDVAEPYRLPFLGPLRSLTNPQDRGFGRDQRERKQGERQGYHESKTPICGVRLVPRRFGGQTSTPLSSEIRLASGHF